MGDSHTTAPDGAAKDIACIVDRMLGGDRSALARLMTIVENRAAASPSIMSRIFSRCGRAYFVGMTGPPGAGKSTLTDRLVARARANDVSIGVIAVDPSSPFSGGAVLGDRIRMQDHFLDPRVFIRSVSSRGSHGGVARPTRDLMRLLDAFGFDYVFVETVGVGQTELGVMELVDSTVVALVPEAGDAIQVMKAGLLEIADVFVVNKADRPGADQMQKDLETMLQLRGQTPWMIPVLLTEAVCDRGVDSVWKTIVAHRKHREERGTRAQGSPERRQGELLDILDEELRRRLRRSLACPQARRPDGLVEAVRAGNVDPYTAALTILADTERLSALVESEEPAE